MQLRLHKFEQFGRYRCLLHFSLAYLSEVRFDLLNQFGLRRLVLVAVSGLACLLALLRLCRGHFQRLRGLGHLRIVLKELLDLSVDYAVEVYVGAKKKG